MGACRRTFFHLGFTRNALFVKHFKKIPQEKCLIVGKNTACKRRMKGLGKKTRSQTRLRNRSTTPFTSAQDSVSKHLGCSPVPLICLCGRVGVCQTNNFNLYLCLRQSTAAPRAAFSCPDTDRFGRESGHLQGHVAVAARGASRLVSRRETL